MDLYIPRRRWRGGREGGMRENKRACEIRRKEASAWHALRQSRGNGLALDFDNTTLKKAVWINTALLFILGITLRILCYSLNNTRRNKQESQVGWPREFPLEAARVAQLCVPHIYNTPSIVAADRRIDCFMHAGPLRDSGIAPGLRNCRGGLVNARYVVCNDATGSRYFVGGNWFVMARINRLSDTCHVRCRTGLYLLMSTIRMKLMSAKIIVRTC